MKNEGMKIKSGYKKTPVGIIPKDWEVVRLGEICSHFKSGTGITARDIFEAGEYPVYGGNGLRGYTETYTHDGKYVLIGRQGALCGNIQEVKGKQFISEHAIAVQTNEKNHLDFLAKKLTYYNLNRLSESSAQPGLAVNKLVRLRLGIPPLPEQKAIADCLSVWDRGIEKLTALIDAKKEQRKGLMQQLLTGKKRLSGFEGKWKEVRLGEIGEFKNGINKSKEDFGFGVPFINLNDIFNLKLDKLELVNATTKEINQYDLKVGDVLFVRSSVKPSGVGLTIVIENNLPKTVYSGFIIRFRENFHLNIGYKKYCFDEEHFRHRLMSKSTISANTNINQQALRSLYIKIPPLEEQTAIAEILSAADREIRLLEQKLEAMQEQKKGLMQALLTGKKRLGMKE